MSGTAIIGAGAAGLSLGLMLDDDFTIFEAQDVPGGLCRSGGYEDWVWDQGPHILGGIPEAVEWVVESTGIEFVEGETRNRSIRGTTFGPHPFTDESDGRRYMEKMWKTDPSLLSTFGLTQQKGRQPGGVKTFLYPATGGYQAITDAWAAQLDGKIRYSAPGVDFSNFDRVVLTAPGGDGWGIGLRYNFLTTATIGYKGPAPRMTALYCADPVVPFHRLSFPSAFSSNNAPEGHFSVQGEVSHPVALELNPGPMLHEYMKRIGLADGEPIFCSVGMSHFAYPVPLEETELRFAQIREQLEGEELYLHGRTGAHQYLNVDGVVKASMDLAERLNA